MLGFISCKKENQENKLLAQHDIIDTIKNVTIHVMPEDLLENQTDSVQSYYKKFKIMKFGMIGKIEDLIAQIENCKI